MGDIVTVLSWTFFAFVVFGALYGSGQLFYSRHRTGCHYNSIWKISSCRQSRAELEVADD